MPTPTRSGVRLHKHLADLGLESRRTIERWIAEGKIKVDGRVAQLGDKVTDDSRITVKGRALRITAPTRRRILLYHKPEGEISTRKDPDKRPTVYQRLPKLKGERWVAVGRLDINTRGLMLFTNDGELANRLMHPRYGIEREYLCRVYGNVNADAIARLQRGITLDKQRVRFLRVQRHRTHGDKSDGRNHWYSVVVGEGKFREVRRMWEAVGCRLSRLLRVRYGDLVLPKTLRQRQWEELKPAAVAAVLTSVDLAVPDESRAQEKVTVRNIPSKTRRKTSRPVTKKSPRTVTKKSPRKKTTRKRKPNV